MKNSLTRIGLLVVSLMIVIAIPMDCVMAQDGQIQGRVVDGVNGSSIAYAYVQIENSNFRTQADFEGKFSMNNLPEQNEEFVFSAVGYETFACKFDVNRKQILNVQAQLRPIIYFTKKVEALSHDTIYIPTSARNADMILSGRALSRFKQSSYNMQSFLTLITNALAGLRTGAVSILLNGTWFMTKDPNMLPLMPNDLVRVEVYKPYNISATRPSFTANGWTLNLVTKNN
jgi:hypothetical protein